MLWLRFQVTAAALPRHRDRRGGDLYWKWWAFVFKNDEFCIRWHTRPCGALRWGSFLIRFYPFCVLFKMRFFMALSTETDGSDRLLMGMMSLGRTFSPFFAGLLFESSIFETQDFSTSQDVRFYSLLPYFSLTFPLISPTFPYFPLIFPYFPQPLPSQILIFTCFLLTFAIGWCVRSQAARSGLLRPVVGFLH